MKTDADQEDIKLARVGQLSTMRGSLKISRALLHLLVPLAAIPFLTFGGAAAQEKPKIDVVAQLGHSDLVSSVAFSPDGRTALSGSEDNSLKLWDVATGKLIRTFTGHSAFVNSVAFSPNGRTVLSGSSDKTLRLWDVMTGKLIRTFEGHSFEVTSVAISADGRTLLSGSLDQTLKLWDAATGKLVRTFQGHSASIMSVAFSPDSRTVASSDVDGTLKLWDVAKGNLLRSFWAHSGGADSVAFSPDGQTVLSGGDYTLRLWDVTKGTLLRTFERHSLAVSSVAFSRDGRTALSGSYDKTLKLWDVATGKVLRTFEGHSGSVMSVAFSPDGRTVLSGSSDKTLRLWDVATGKGVRTFEPHSRPVRAVALSADGRTVLLGTGDPIDRDTQTIELWEAATGKLVHAIKMTDRVWSVAFSRDGRTVLSGDLDNGLKLWNIATGKVLRTFEGHSGSVMSVAFSPDGRTVLSGSSDKTLRLWDVTTGKLIRTFTGHLSSVDAVAFSPDGRTVASSSEVLKLWDVATGKVVREFARSRAGNSIAFSPDGRTLLSGTGANTFELWDVTTGKLVRSFSGHSNIVNSVGFSPDGRIALSGSVDDTLKLWDPTTGRLLRTFEGNSRWIESVAFSPDGRTVLSGGADGTVRFWSLSSGDEILRLVSSLDGEWLAMTPAGFFNASEGGLEMVSVVRGLEVFSVDQFRDELQRKDLLRELVSGDPLRIYAKSAERLNLDAVLNSGEPPEVQLIGRELAGDSVRLTVRLFNNTGGGIGTGLKWRVNGVVQGDTEPPALQSPQARIGPITVAQGLKLDPKRDNVITVTAYNGKNMLASRPLRIVVSKGDIIEGEERRPRLYILAIGVNTYVEPRLKSLDLAVTDVKALAGAFARIARAGGYDVPTPKILDEDRATKTGIELGFKELAAKDIDQRDALIVLLAGHGASDGKCYYFLPSGTTFAGGQSIRTQGVSCDDWENMIGKVQAGKKALFIDTCDSADATSILRGANDNVRREGTIERLSRSSGQSIFSAARDAAHEDVQLGHGLLTYAVLEALARPGPRGDVDADSIKLFVDDEVPKLSERWYQQRQEPSVKVKGIFPLGPAQASVAPTPRATPQAGRYIVSGPNRIKLYDSIGSTRTVLQELDPYSEVQVFEFRADGWALVGRGGPPLGWVASDAVHRIN